MKYEEPTMKVVPGYGSGTTEEFSHDAFGMIGISVITGGDGTLFGSDLKHGQQVRISIKRAKHQRHLANDWYHADSLPIAEVSLSHNQFAELITSPNRGDGVPCTINYAPARGTKTEAMPGIKRVKKVADIYRKEIQDSAKQKLEAMQAQVAALGAALEKPSLSKKELKELHASLSNAVGRIPADIGFIVDQAEEAMEKAVTSAKTDVEAYIGTRIMKLGLETARGLGLTSEVTQGFLGYDDSNTIDEVK